MTEIVRDRKRPSAPSAGGDISRAVYYPEDEGCLLEKPERLRHYRLEAAPDRGAGIPEHQVEG